MATTAQVDNAKTLLGISGTSQDALLTLLETNCNGEFLSYTGRTEVPASSSSLITDMMIIRYNRLKTEGIASQNYSGVSQSYEADYSPSIIRQLNSYRVLKVF